MRKIKKIYINGEFVTPHGTKVLDLISPITNKKIAEVTLADEVDTRNAIAAAKEALKEFSKTTKEERLNYLDRLYNAFKNREKDLIKVMIEEYGGTLQFCNLAIGGGINDFKIMAETLLNFEFERAVGNSKVRMESIGVVGIITPWNASNMFQFTKLSAAISAGCTVVIKPSDISAQQSHVLAECIHEAGLPKGVINIVTGSGSVVGTELTRNPDVSKITFTGSTEVGKMIAKNATDTMKRVVLELGGKSPNIILDDADLSKAIPLALMIAFMNSGQACIAGTRLLVPESKLEEVNEIVKKIINGIKVGDPVESDTQVGPMVSQKQFNRVQEYIRLGIEEGATLLTGGLGKPKGLEAGNFIKLTVFTNVKNNMRIAQEEIFGPVLCIIPFKNDEDAIRIANDTIYGLHAYVSSSDVNRANKIAAAVEAGRVCVNGFTLDSKVPFGGFKQSGYGRECGEFGLTSYLEPKAILQ